MLIFVKTLIFLPTVAHCTVSCDGDMEAALFVPWYVTSTRVLNRKMRLFVATFETWLNESFWIVLQGEINSDFFRLLTWSQASFACWRGNGLQWCQIKYKLKYLDISSIKGIAVLPSKMFLCCLLPLFNVFRCLHACLAFVWRCFPHKNVSYNA